MVFADTSLEQSLWQNGFPLVCGIDEVGRGCFAGPVVAGAVIFSSISKIPKGIADSKLLKPQVREDLAELIKESAEAWAVGLIDVLDINKFGIGKATQMAFRKAIRCLNLNPDFVIFDAFYNFNEAKISSSAYIAHYKREKQRPVKDGDKLSVSIAAASIVAKVFRDKLMEEMDLKFPGYGFSKHKGYGTKFHQEAIKKLGLSNLHRKSFDLNKFLI